MDRRTFLLSSASAIATSRTPFWFEASKPPVPITLTINPTVSHNVIPTGFSGLSYEAQQMASPGFFSAQNKNLVAMFRRLGGGGVLRIGGSTSEHIGWWSEDSTISSPNYYSSFGPEDAMHHLYRGAVTPIAIKNLRNFLDATDWKLIYGLSLKNRTIEHSVAEASFVIDTIGQRLLVLQLGNEPDIYSTDKIRWTYDYYYEQWKSLRDAISSLHPDIQFGGPDIAHGVEWIAPFATQAGKQIKLLTSHYYAEGPPTEPAMNINKLLGEDRQLTSNISAIQKIGSDSGLPYRLTECNSCYHGGKAGVSDTFASALWGGDFMFELAQAGFTGVNFHGGGNGYYSPIAGSINTGFVARPIYYGMLLFSQFLHSSFIPSALETQGIDLTAYASLADTGQIRVAVFNKELKESAQVRVDAGQAASIAHILRLAAPSLDSKTGVTFGGSQVSTDGGWKPRWNEQLYREGGEFIVNVPAASAAVITLG